ncbi:MAG: polyvinylalcohol dehydrogenase [Verrucomicrobiaceae bacterium]|nr:MAG: polyvinylalcohol dehydrogenase [Verrucomicrobiaceae bacterium]
MKRFLSLSLLLAFGQTLLTAADWPQWRGENRDDHSPDKSILNPWPAKGPKQLWVFKEAGLGYSGFSVVGDRLFTMGAIKDGENVICVDPVTGKQKWSVQLDSRIYPNNWGDGPRSTPTVDGDRVYALSANGILGCLSVKDGAILWKKDLIEEMGGKLQDWGYTESVLVEGDKVICTPGGAQGTLAALDKKTGKVLWRSTGIKEPAQYSSTVPVTVNGQRQIVQLLTKKVFGVNPANGELLWQSNFSGSVAVIPTPIFKDGYLYVTAGYGVGCRMYKLGEKEPEIVYENNVIVNHHGGVVLVDGKLYGHSDKGGWKCQDFMTGEEVWKSDAMGKGGIGYAAGHLVCVEEQTGNVALIAASDKGWKEEGRFKLDPQSAQRKPQGKIWVHPVILNGRLYLRDQELIYCYDVKGG